MLGKQVTTNDIILLAETWNVSFAIATLDGSSIATIGGAQISANVVFRLLEVQNL